MAEYFILVNETTNEYIDPDEFPTPYGITHTAWLTEPHACLPCYLLTETAFDMFNDYDAGNWCGAWAGDQIRFIGDTITSDTPITTRYTSVSKAVFTDIALLFEWFVDTDAARSVPPLNSTHHDVA